MNSLDPSTLSLYSVVIPARDESESLPETLQDLYRVFTRENIPHEIVVVDDGSSDGTFEVLETLRHEIPTLIPVKNTGFNGFGNAVIYGLDHSHGDAVVIMMADASDDPEHAANYWKILNDQKVDCVFGSRFIRGGKVVDYPPIKYFLNRLTNLGIKFVFSIPYNDTTNAFKAYRRTVIDGCRPFLSHHFNLTVEIPLKAIVRGFTWTVIPISWQNRKHGIAKLKIKEMGSRYFFIFAYTWLEKYFSRGDYLKSRQKKR